ncbi:MAG: GNAT family N-acetyltransferase [Bacteriovoracaceae bacterium]
MKTSSIFVKDRLEVWLTDLESHVFTNEKEKNLFYPIFELDQLYFEPAWSNERWFSLLGTARKFLLLEIKENSKLRGFLLAEVNEGSSFVEIHKVLIVPDCRGRGFGKLLVSLLKEEVIKRSEESIILQVAEDNQKARGLYQHLGFQKIRTLDSYYASGKNALELIWKNDLAMCRQAPLQAQ